MRRTTGSFKQGLRVACAVAALSLAAMSATAQAAPNDWRVGGPSSGDFGGAWNTSEGSMTLQQSGGDVSGTYSQDNGRIEGQVSGSRLTGYWGEDSSANPCPTQRLGTSAWGRIDWALDADARHFSGRWSYCDAEPAGSWTGDRTDTAVSSSGPGDNGPSGDDGQAADPTHGQTGDHGQYDDQHHYGDQGQSGDQRHDYGQGDHGGAPSGYDGNQGASATERLLVDIGNPYLCGVTDTATLDLDRPTHLTRVDIWFRWQSDESSVGYTVTSGGEQVGGGTLQRAECDPYQGAWCVARDTPDVDLAPGRYEFRTARRGVCQNSGSDGAGFIKAYGYDQ